MAEDQMPPELEIVDSHSSSELSVNVDAPYRVLVIGDYGGGETGSVSGPLQQGVLDLKADDFDDALATASPSVELKTTDPTVPGSVMAVLNLRFTSLRDFEPASLAMQIPGAAALMDVRERLVSRLLGKIDANQLNDDVAGRAAAAGSEWLVASLKWSPTPSPEASQAADQLLDQLELGDDNAAPAAAPSPPKSPIAAIVSGAAKAGGTPAPEAAAIRRTLAEIDRRVSLWLTSVLHSPAIQSLEAAWRGLAHLVKQIDFRSGVRLSILHATRGDIVKRFTACVIDPVFDAGADAPDLIAVDATFGQTAPELEMLDHLAQHAASLPAIAVVGVGPAFFGVKFPWQVPTLPPLFNVFDQYQFAKYKTLRTQQYSRSLALIFGRGLIRDRYGRRDGAPEFEFAYNEPCAGDKDLTWSSGALATAACVARSIAVVAWPTQITGLTTGSIEGYAIAAGGEKNAKRFGPADVELTTDKIKEIAMVGINSLVSVRDRSDAIAWNQYTVARPLRGEESALLEVSLPYQLFAQRLSNLLLALKPKLSGMQDDDIVPLVKSHVQTWLGMPDVAANMDLTVQLATPPETPGQRHLIVRVTPPVAIVPRGIPCLVGFQIR